MTLVEQFTFYNYFYEQQVMKNSLQDGDHCVMILCIT